LSSGLLCPTLLLLLGDHHPPKLGKSPLVLLKKLFAGLDDAPPRQWPFRLAGGEVFGKHWDPGPRCDGFAVIVRIEEVVIGKLILTIHDKGSVQIDMSSTPNVDPIGIDAIEGHGKAQTKEATATNTNTNTSTSTTSPLAPIRCVHDVVHHGIKIGYDLPGPCRILLLLQLLLLLRGNRGWRRMGTR